MTTPIRVIIVDDHRLLRDGIIAWTREDPGITVVGEAGNGEEALAEARRLDPDLVVMDLDMPVLGGLETTRRLRAGQPRTRVLILTMHNLDHYVEQSLAAGARGYVLKSDGAEALLRAIRVVHQGGLYFSDGVACPFRPAAARASPERLSERETEVLCLIAAGLTNREVARTLGILTRTVESHRLNIRSKLGITQSGALPLARYAITHGICPGLSTDRGL